MKQSANSYIRMEGRFDKIRFSKHNIPDFRTNVVRRGFKSSLLSTARGFGKRAFKSSMLSTARGFGKRPFSTNHIKPAYADELSR